MQEPKSGGAGAGRAAVAYLQGLSRFGMRLGLERIRRLLAGLGHPEEGLPPVYHITGTNGKGSTASLIEAILRAAGYRTALFTSPHLVHYEERFLFDGQPVPGVELAAAVDRARRVATALVAEGTGEPPTEFEVATAVFFLLVQGRRPDAVVLEVGLGGRYDATNTAPRPAVAVVTNVALDHMDRLGPTVEAIAYDKVGIARPGVPLVTGAQDPAALAVLRGETAALGAPLWEVRPVGAAGGAGAGGAAGRGGAPGGGGAAGGGGTEGPGVGASGGPGLRGGATAGQGDAGVGPRAGARAGADAPAAVAVYRLRSTGPGGSRWDYLGPAAAAIRWENLPLALVGPHQVANAAVAVTALLAAAGTGRGLPVGREAVERGLATARWPGRMERVRWQGRELWLDGAHNPAGMAALARTAATLWPGRRILLVVGMLDDKQVEEAAAAIAPVTERAVVTEPPSSRAASAERVARALAGRGVPVVVQREPLAALAQAVEGAESGRPVLVTGSLYLVGAIRGHVLHPAAAPGT